MKVLFSSGSGPDEAMVISTDLHNKCTSRHTGTSAAAPMAAGIFALVLQSNPDLTWRDLQHLVAFTSRKEPLEKNKGWKQNGAGFWVNEGFGFGLLNAEGLVNAADKRVWESIGPQKSCERYGNKDHVPKSLLNGEKIQINFNIGNCEINFLEHVVVTINMSYTVRGALKISLLSPAQTETLLLPQRPADNSSEGLKYWPFMSVHTWGENPNGDWKLIIEDVDNNKNNHGQITSLKFHFYGTVQYPKYYSDHFLNSAKVHLFFFQSSKLFPM